MSSKRVLVVEDDLATSRLIGEILRPSRAELEFVEDGVDALASLVKSAPDLIILDIALPRVDGWHVLDALRQGRLLTGDVPVIVITAHGQGMAAERALDGGANRFFEKPFIPAELALAVEELLADAV